MPADRRPTGRRRFQPLAVLTLVLILALVVAAFFFAFLVIPLAVLVLFYIGIAAFDRLRHRPDASDG